jgi:gamma-glutamyltranspeptidase/glutathione hydrolase
VTRPQLARALKLIAEQGADAFYRGPLGEAVLRVVEESGGQMSGRDLSEYRVHVREPVRFLYLGHEVVSVPPASSGGVCLAEALGILNVCAERSDLDPAGEPHVLVEAMKHAFADRARWLGDPAFTRIPVNQLTSFAYAAALAQRIRPEKTQAPESYGSSPPSLPSRDQGTSHFCVADRLGNVVAMTETINGSFGSFVVTEPYGIILNNEMDDFAAEPGKPNLYGLVQGKANAIAPGKRPLSSMSPTLVFERKKPVLAVGASGGPRIITAVLQVIRNVVSKKMSLEEAVSARRLHHQWLPDEVYFDGPPSKDVVDALTAAGHKIAKARKGAVVQAIRFTKDGEMVGASDPRKGGRPAGANGPTGHNPPRKGRTHGPHDEETQREADKAD